MVRVVSLINSGADINTGAEVSSNSSDYACDSLS